MSFTSGVTVKSTKSAAAVAKESSKLKHSENEAARRKRLADKFLALEAMVNDESNHGDGSVSGGEQDGSGRAPPAEASRIHILQSAIDALKLQRNTIDKLEAKLAAAAAAAAANSNASSSMGDAANTNMAPSSTTPSHATSAASASAAAAAANHGAAPMTLSINPTSPAHVTSPTATDLLRSNVFFAAQAAAAAGGVQNHHMTSNAGPLNAAAHTQHTEQDYQLLAALAQQQQMQIQQMQMAAQSQALSPPGSGSSGVKRSSSSARLAELHHLQQTDAPMHASSLDRQTSGHNTDYHSSAASSAASGTRSRAASATGSQPPQLNMIGVGTGSMMTGSGAAVTPASLAASLEIHKRRRTFDEDQNLAAFAAASAAAAASSAAAATAASSGTAPGTPRTGAGSISRSPAQGGRSMLSPSSAVHFVPLASLPLLAAQPCFLCTLDGVMLDCTPSFLSLLGYPTSGDAQHDKAAVVSQSLFSLLHPADVKNALATVKNVLWTGAQAQATAPGSVSANLLSGIEDVVKNFLRPLGAPAALGSRRSSGASTAGSPMVLSAAASATALRMVLFAVANRSAGPSAPLNMLFGIVAPLSDPSSGAPLSVAPHGFPHGSKACQAEIARECFDMLDVDQQGYLVAMMYGVPAQKLGGSGSGTPRSGMVGMHTGLGGGGTSGTAGVLGPSASPIHASLPSPGHATSLYRPLHPHSSPPAAHQHTGSGLMPPQSSSLFNQALSGSHSRSPSSGGGGGGAAVGAGGTSMHGSMSHQNLASMAAGYSNNPLSPSSSSKSAAALHAEQHHLAMLHQQQQQQQQPHSAGGFRMHTNSPMMHLQQHQHHEPEHGSLALPLMQRSRTVQSAHGTPGQQPQHVQHQYPQHTQQQQQQQPNSPLHPDLQLPSLPHAHSTPLPHTPHHASSHLGSPLEPQHQHLFRSPLTHAGGAGTGEDPNLAVVGTPFTPVALSFAPENHSGAGGVPASFGSPGFAPATTNSLPPVSPALFQSYSGIGGGGNGGLGHGASTGGGLQGLGSNHAYPSPLSPFTMVRHGSSIESHGANGDGGDGGTQSSGEGDGSSGDNGSGGGGAGVDLMDSGASVAADLNDDMHSLQQPPQAQLHDPSNDDDVPHHAGGGGLVCTPPDDSIMEAEAASFD